MRRVTSILILAGFVMCAGACSDAEEPNADSDGKVKIVVLDGQGRTLPGSVLRTEGGHERGVFHDHTGHGFGIPRDWAPLVVTGPGHRPKRIEALEGDRMELRLEPGFPIRLVLPDDLVLPEPPRFLTVEIHETDGDLGEELAEYLDAWMPERRDDWEADGQPPISFRSDRRTLDLLVHRLGSYEVRWGVHRVEWSRSRGHERRSIAGTIPAGPYQTFTVTEGEPTTVVLEIDVDQMRSLARLK